ncbi:MAG: DUF4340 domain-containing protein, partial [Planctomycetota bacterium]|nr:DUF4340 domain-containing protein [Planctomycetota bacterium]
RGEDGWRLEEPLSWPADEARLDLLIRWVDKLRAAAVETDAPGDPGEYGLGSVAAYVEAARAEPGGTRRGRVIFGWKTAAGRRYARVEGRSPVFSVPAGTTDEIYLDEAAAYPKVWRDFYRRRSLNLAGGAIPSEIVIERLRPFPVRLILRPAGAGGWSGRLEEKGIWREFPVEPPDPAPAEAMRPLNAILTGLSSLRIQSFLADSPPDPEGGANGFPAWRFYCLAPNGDPLPTLTLYAAGPDGVLPPGELFPEGSGDPVAPMAPRLPGIAFSVSDQPALMEAPGEIAYLLCLPPYRYQSPQLAAGEAEEWDKVEITAGKESRIYFRGSNGWNDQWWLEGEPPEPLLDDNNAFSALLENLSRLRAEAWIADAGARATDFGLDLPEITAIVYGNRGAGGRRRKLSLGRAADAAEGARFARLDDSGPVFLVSGDFAASLAKSYH